MICAVFNTGYKRKGFIILSQIMYYSQEKSKYQYPFLFENEEERLWGRRSHW
jgi:hypothetical protein